MLNQHNRLTWVGNNDRQSEVKRINRGNRRDKMKKQKNNRVINGFYFVKLYNDWDWEVLKWEDMWDKGGEWSYPGSDQGNGSDEFACIEERIKMPNEIDKLKEDSELLDWIDDNLGRYKTIGEIGRDSDGFYTHRRSPELIEADNIRDLIKRAMGV